MDYKTVEIELSDSQLGKLARLAHKQDITINEYVNILFKKDINKLNKQYNIIKILKLNLLNKKIKMLRVA